MSAVFDLKERLSQMGVAPKKAFGQNFLVNAHVIGKIIDAVQFQKIENIIEIGPGLGALTEPLLAAALKPKLIEFDPDLAKYWQTRGLEVHYADALKFDWDSLALKSPALLVSNLPYQISSRLVIDRCLDRKPMVAMILMFQKEVAIRILAECGDTDYGMLSVFVSQFWSIRKVCDADPRSFMPSPQVASQVLAFQRHETEIANPQKYLSFLKQSFQHPRRKMVSNLAQGGFDKHEVLDLFAKIGLKEGARPHEVTGGQFAAIFKGLQKSMAAQ